MLGEKDRGRPQLVGATGLVLKQRFPSLQDGPSGALLRFMETPYQFKALGRHVVGKKTITWMNCEGFGMALGCRTSKRGVKVIQWYSYAQAPEWWRGRNSAELTDVTLQNLVLQCDYFADIK